MLPDLQQITSLRQKKGAISGSLFFFGKTSCRLEVSSQTRVHRVPVTILANTLRTKTGAPNVTLKCRRHIRRAPPVPPHADTQAGSQKVPNIPFAFNQVASGAGATARRTVRPAAAVHIGPLKGPTEK